MSQGELFPAEPGSGVLFTNTSMLDDAINLARKNSVHYLLFGLACCGIELMQTGGPRADLDRFAAIFRASPRQADLMIISGTVTKKLIPQIVRLYNQMGEPKYVIAMGACASGGGPFKEGYNVVSGVDQFVPVDVYVPGCPPTPQALLHGFGKLREKIDTQSVTSVRWYRKAPIEAIPIPLLGPDLINPRDLPALREKAVQPAQPSQP